jgi:PAS domain S-box-containing protein
MPAAKIPKNEKNRLLALKRLKVLDTVAEKEFDAIVKAASLVCGVPISLISLVDESRQWFKANVGLEGVSETPRNLAFCAHAILGKDILEVENATQDIRFSDNPLVLDNPNIRFYTGVPLKLSTGENVGTLCVIDSKTHVLTEEQREILKHLGVVASQALESRKLRESERAILTAEEALLEAADYTASIFHNTKEPILALMLDGTITHWNLAAQKLFGYTQEEMLGGNVAQLIPMDHINDYDEVILKIANLPDGLSYETQRLSKTGELIDVTVSIAPLYNGAGRLIGSTKIVHDNRESIRNRKLLANNEARYRALSDTSPFGVFATDASGACTYTNNRWQEIFGLSLADSLGVGWRDAIHPLDREAVFLEWQRSASEHIEFDMEFRIKYLDGTVRYVHSRSRPVIDENENIISFVGCVEDISERRRTLERLATSEERLRRLYQSTPALLQSIDPQGRLIDVSDYWLQKHGYTREEVIGKHSADFMTKESAQHARNVVIPMVMEKGFCEEIAYKRQKKNGEVFDVLLSSVLERDNSGNPLRAISVMVDVTAENNAKRATEELLSTMRNEFITSITDVQGNITEVNDAFCEISQYTREELIGKNHRIVNSGVHPKAYFAEMFATISKGHSWHGEKCNRAKDGSLYWTDAVISPLTDTNGKIERYVSIASNITNRKMAEKDLIEQKNKIHQILENQSVATFSIDAQHKVTQWNKACEVLTGVDECNILGNEAWHGFYSEMRPCLADMVLNSENKLVIEYYPVSQPSILIKNGWHAENWFDSLGGERRYLIFDATPIFDENGNISEVIETLQDITESKMAEIALEDERQNLASVIEGTKAGTWQWNVVTGECNFNETWATMIGYTLAELKLHSFDIWAKHVHPDDLIKANDNLSKHFNGENDQYEAEFRMKHKAGQWVWILARGRVLSWTEDHKPVWVYGTHTDIGERKKQEIALQKSQEFLDRTGRMAGVGGWELDLTTNQVYWSDQLCLIHGVAPGYKPTYEEAVNAYPSGAREILESTIKNAIETDGCWDLELPYTCADGSSIWVRTQGSVEFVEGKAIRLYGAFQDITLRIEQQNSIVAANERVTIATKSGGIGIWGYDVLNDLLSTDTTINMLYGLPEEVVMTVDMWTSMLHPDDREDTVLAFQDAIAGISEYDVEFRAVWRDGTIHYIRAKATVTCDQDGRALQMLGTNWDVTALRELTLEVAKQHETLRVTLKSIGDAVITTDAKGRITWLNPVAERMTGWLSEEAKNKQLAQVFNILNESSRTIADNPIAECLKRGNKAGFANQTILISRDGIEYGIEYSASPIRSDNGRIIGAVLVFHDVTEQRRLSSEMRYRATH